VTLNSRAPIDESLIYDVTTFRHPVYDLAALAAQGTVREMNGDNATWFCGAWMKNGFHEDGYASAMDVVEAIAAGTRRRRRRMTARVDHIAGETFHGRRGAVENAFKYGIDYVMVDAEAAPLRARGFSGATARGSCRFGIAIMAAPPRRGGASLGAGGAGHPWAGEVTDGASCCSHSRARWGMCSTRSVSGWPMTGRRLRAVISEVSNTFGDRHSYLCAHDDHRPITREDTLSAQKIFHVSPFQPIEGAIPSASTFARTGSASGSTTAPGTRGFTPRSPASARR
jgi:hypothetical protein